VIDKAAAPAAAGYSGVVERQRLDSAVAARTGLTRSQARGLILAGRIRVDGHPAAKAGALLRAGAQLEVEAPPAFVSRGGEKLAAALAAFDLSPAGCDVLDVGASTGGFTDAVLARGAKHVTALDVGYGQLAWKLRTDPRVTVVERTNFRTLGDDAFPGGFELIVIDASFISVRTIVARAKAYLRPGGSIVALVKPQFEAGRERIGGGGVVRDPEVHRAILREVRDALGALGLAAVDAATSPLRGPAGNREFFYRIMQSGTPIDDARINALVCESHGAEV
jgi:23S rRNA (cytidine1920-2'-O)/16S rRNA (cytidine1409-2'-O)-methyltransferase